MAREDDIDPHFRWYIWKACLKQDSKSHNGSINMPLQIPIDMDNLLPNGFISALLMIRPKIDIRFLAQKKTGATRVPVFWDITHPIHDFPFYQFISDPFHSKSKLCCILTKRRMYVKGYTQYICIKFNRCSIKTGLRNVNKVQIPN